VSGVWSEAGEEGEEETGVAHAGWAED